MIRTYFKIAWNNLRKNKVFSFINIFGLAAGLACCMLITLYIRNEVSYDKYHKHAADIYQLGTNFIREGKETKMSGTPAPVAQAMQFEYPEIEQTTRLLALFNEDKTLLQYNEKNAAPQSFYETKGYIADSSFFRVFTYDFLEGNPATALNEPRTVVLSEEIARKIFGNQPALNKLLHISSGTNGDYDFMVTGVFRPVSKPSHIDARFFLSFKGGEIEQLANRMATNFANNNMFFTYLQLKPGTDVAALQAKFPAFIDKYAGKD
ncbi:MAG TPA: ABC transporter permease, partial [Ferruginibacter sp.]|nr:ABC transporter permease [Ferruginibacter sp.]